MKLDGALHVAVENPLHYLEKHKLIPVSSTPKVLSNKVFTTLSNQASSVYSAINKLAIAYHDDRALRALFPEYSAYEFLYEISPHTNQHLWLCRFDFACLTDNQFKMMETNAACPGVLTTVGSINRTYLSGPDNKTNPNEFVNLTIDQEAYFIEGLIQTFQERTQNSDLVPVIAFVNSRHRKLETDLSALVEIGHRHGIECLMCEVQSLRYENGKLIYEDQVIDLVYLKLDTVIDDEQDCDLGAYGKAIDSKDSPLFAAIREGTVHCLNSFVSILFAESKKVLAMLHDKGFQETFLDPTEVGAINSLVAKTSYLEVNGRPWLWSLSEIIENKDQYVLKSVMDSRGRGIFIGYYMSDSEWAQTVEACLNKPFVVQEYLPLLQEEINSPISPTKQIMAFTDIGLYLIAGRAIGFLCRASLNPIVNVGKEGALRPTFVTKM